MGDVLRDAMRLYLLHEMPIAQERMSVASHLKDFTYYYFSRFTLNLKTVFSTFTTSEIADFNRRHLHGLKLLTKGSLPNVGQVILPIPKGMLNPYQKTLEALVKVLNSTSAASIRQDLEQLRDAMKAKTLPGSTLPSYSKTQFDQAKVQIGLLFGKTGLTHATAEHVLATTQEIDEVNTKLLELTQTYYPELLVIGQVIEEIEHLHSDGQWSERNKLILSGKLMSLAYRLSIIAVVMDHVQKVEHGFVQSLSILLKKIS